MNTKPIYLILIILILLTAILGATFAYFGTNVIRSEERSNQVSTGNLELTISDSSVNANNLTPIYDQNYQTQAYVKTFSITTSSNSLNACSTINLNINSISESLKSEYFKYKIVSSTGQSVVGDFRGIDSNDNLFLMNGEYIATSTTKTYTLYIWISYQNDVNQLNMLGTSLDAKISIKSSDCKDSSYCEPSLYYNINNNSISNEYIVFANKCFQVIKSNSDKTTRVRYYSEIGDNGCLDSSVISTSTYSNQQFVNSNIKTTLDNWYQANLLAIGENVVSKISDNSFCENIGECNSVGILNGNGLLKYPIGLLTLDDLDNISVTNDAWLITPYNENEMYTTLGHKLNNQNSGIIPVISLKNNVKILSGIGSKEEPYYIDME